MKFINPLMLILCLLFTGCLQQVPDDIIDEEKTREEIRQEAEEMDFEGIGKPIKVTDSTIMLDWPYTVLADNFTVYDVTNPGQKKIIAVVVSPTTNFEVKNLEADTVYKFQVKANDSLGFEDKNEKILSVKTLSKPDQVTQVDLIFPAYNIGLENRPIIRVSPTKEGEIIHVYTDDTCTTEHMTTVAPAGISSDVYLDPLAVGFHNLYIQLENKSGNLSDCSTANAQYTVSDCPNMYARISANPAMGTTGDFCVSKFEMKCAISSDGLACNAQTPQSKPENKPWRLVSQADAKAACALLGPQYHLITNAEWMTVAREIETNLKNWKDEDNSITSKLNFGHSLNTPNTYLEGNADPEKSCHGITNTNENNCSLSIWHEQRRTFFTSSNDTIWDFAGNVWEWVDYSITNDKASGNYTWMEIKDIGFTPGFPVDAISPQDTNLTHLNNVGSYYATEDGLPSVARRGGNINHGEGSGIYSMVLREGASELSGDIGFRCAYTIP